MRLGWFPKASYTDLSICCHFELPKGRERNFACHPHSPPVGKIQKHSTPPSGVPFLMNLDPWGTDSYSANWQHNSSNALFCEFFHGRREFQSVGIGANSIFVSSNRARNFGTSGRALGQGQTQIGGNWRGCGSFAVCSFHPRQTA